MYLLGLDIGSSSVKVSLVNAKTGEITAFDYFPESVPVGSDGVSIIPFGNGAERVIQNKEIGCSVHGVNFNKHNKATLMRASQEGIVFSFCYAST